MNVLQIDVEKRFDGIHLAFAFESEGPVTGLFGPSGAGKTTLVSMIAGLVRPAAGRIAIDGVTLFDSTRAIDVPVHLRRIGYVFQEGRLFPHMSVSENLDYGRRMLKLPHDVPEFRRIVTMLDIEPLLSRRPGKLSGGERQRVAIGRALMSRPQLLLLDEPLAALDPVRKSEIMPYLLRLRDEAAIPMIYVSHYARELKRIANVIVRLQDGKVASIGGIEILGAADEAAFV